MKLLDLQPQCLSYPQIIHISLLTASIMAFTKYNCPNNTASSLVVTLRRPAWKGSDVADVKMARSLLMVFGRWPNKLGWAVCKSKSCGYKIYNLI